MIAQDVEETMKEHGIDSMDFAAFIKEKVYGEYLYGLRYEEFIPILIAKVQKQQEQIEELMEKVSALEKAVVKPNYCRSMWTNVYSRGNQQYGKISIYVRFI